MAFFTFLFQKQIDFGAICPIFSVKSVKISKIIGIRHKKRTFFDKFSDFFKKIAISEGLKKNLTPDLNETPNTFYGRKFGRMTDYHPPLIE